jgi:hypothetical protein
MAEQFDWVEGTKTAVSVRHKEGHRYEFTVAERNGRRVLGEGDFRENGLAKHSASFFTQEARNFAEREARERQIID